MGRVRPCARLFGVSPDAQPLSPRASDDREAKELLDAAIVDLVGESVALPGDRAP